MFARVAKFLLFFLLVSHWFENALVAEPVIGVVGTGPSGMEIVKELTNAGFGVILIERTPYVGGNIAHGYFYSKDFSGQLREFREIIRQGKVKFFGNVKVGASGDLTLAELASLDLDALIFSSGSPPKKILMPGHEHAIQSTQIFYYYNGHPDYPDPPQIGQKVAVIGSGSSAIDVIKYLLLQNRGAIYYLLVRRGPGQYGHKHPGYLNVNVSAAANKEAWIQDLLRITPELRAVGEDPATYIKDYVNYAGYRMEYPVNAGSVELIHLVFPVGILHDPAGNITGLELGRNKLIKHGSVIEAVDTKKRFVLDVDTVILSVGATANPDLELPLLDDHVRTINTEDHIIRRDTDVKDQEVYFKNRTLDHYRVAMDDPLFPAFPIYVAGWARLPGIGATDEAVPNGTQFSSVPDGRTLAQLLIKEIKTSGGRTSVGHLEAVATKLSHLLHSKGCKATLSVSVEPTKRPTFEKTSN
jgi:NADPH-dependent glutamate synthase beta subunit-like oxidoreductase